jgi:hypothetical protein
MPARDIERTKAVILDQSSKSQHVVVEPLRSIEVIDIQSGFL